MIRSTLPQRRQSDYRIANYALADGNINQSDGDLSLTTIPGDHSWRGNITVDKAHCGNIADHTGGDLTALLSTRSSITKMVVRLHPAAILPLMSAARSRPTVTQLSHANTNDGAIGSDVTLGLTRHRCRSGATYSLRSHPMQGAAFSRAASGCQCVGKFDDQWVT